MEEDKTKSSFNGEWLLNLKIMYKIFDVDSAEIEYKIIKFWPDLLVKILYGIWDLTLICKIFFIKSTLIQETNYW